MLFFLSLYAARAGDILRGGFSARTAPTSTSGSGNTATVARLRANEQDVLSRTTQALQAVQAMQSAAQNIAQNGPNNLGLDPNHPGQQLPNVPNGLTTGGLQVAPGATANSALWQNANLPTQSASNGQTTVTITQTAPKAILTWQTFNVGKNTTADFDQSAGTQNGTNNWIALNRVLDPTGVPSQILGSIKADGQVYLINQNGIIFGGGSQVNVNTLIASTLNIPDAAFNQGFLAYTANHYTSSAVFSTTMGNAGPSAGNAFPSFSRFYQNSDTGAPSPAATTAPASADVVAQPGSSIATSEGGRVILLGAHVKNGGTISTPDGQTILAAGDSAYLYANPTAPQMRGLSVDVLIDPNTNNTMVNPLADPTAGTTTNSGLITVGKGNATLDGAIIAQNGIISALTGVDFNGSIILTARYAPDTSAAATNNNYISPTIPGSVTFGPYSVTQILPDLSDPTTTLDAQGFNPSVIVVQGKTVAFEGASFPGAPLIGSNGQAISPGAELVAPGGTVSVTAPIAYGLPSQASDFTNAFGLQQPFPFGPIYATTAAAGAGARIFIDNGATIDVSGTQDVSVPVSRNVVAVNLRANELRNSPLQRNGPLYGKTIDVDVTVTGTNADGSTWYGTPFADASRGSPRIVLPSKQQAITQLKRPVHPGAIPWSAAPRLAGPIAGNSRAPLCWLARAISHWPLIPTSAPAPAI
jgi:filamentous hemagglutinin